MKYVDANIFIYPIIGRLRQKESIRCRKILYKIANKDLFACTSLLSWDEFVFVLKRKLGRELAVLRGNKFLEFPNLKFFKVDEKIIYKAQRMITKYNINPRDAIHAASAISNNVDEIITNDKDFDRIDEIKRISLGKFR